MSVATKEKPGRIAHVFGGRYQEREDGTLVRLPPEPVKPYVPTPAAPPLDIDLSLPVWFEEHRIEAREIFRTRKDMAKTASGRAALKEFLARHASRRAELLTRFNEPAPSRGEIRYINAGPGRSHLRNLRAIIMDWLQSTADPVIKELAAKLNQEADDMEKVQLCGPIRPIGGGMTEALRGKLLAKYWATVYVLRRSSVSACANLAATYTDEASLESGLKAVRDKLADEATEVFRERIWKDVRESMPYFVGDTYADFKAGKTVNACVVNEFERIVSDNFTGRPKRPKRYSASGPIPYEDGEIE